VQTIFWSAFTLTFLAEWGDRSQFTTIALSAKFNAFVVFIGGIMGHFICTGLAVLGGKFIENKIEEKWVNLSGGILFVLFGCHSFFFGGEMSNN